MSTLKRLAEEEEEKEGSKNEVLELFERMKKELEERKRETDRLAQLLSDENEKRIRESEAIQERLERGIALYAYKFINNKSSIIPNRM